MNYVIAPSDPSLRKYATFLDEKITKLVNLGYINFTLPQIYLSDMGDRTSSSYNPGWFRILLNIRDVQNLFTYDVPAVDRAFFTRVKKENNLNTPEKMLLFIVLHEIGHVEQEASGKLRNAIRLNACMWKGKFYKTDNFGGVPGVPYTQVPWEYDANMTAIALCRVALEG
jgi:hypothetical protein